MHQAMDETQWNLLVQDTAEHFDDVTIKRGFQYFKQGRVRSLEWAEPRSFEAVVIGTRRYQVHVDLDFFPVSACSCPVGGYCKHIAASLLAYAELQGRPFHALVNAKSAAALLQTASAARMNDAVRRRIRELGAGISEANAAQWRELFELCLEPYADRTRNPEYVELALGTIFRSVPPPEPEELGRLYELNAHLYVMERMADEPRNHGFFYGGSSRFGYYTHLAASELQKKLARLLSRTPDLTADPRLWPRAEETLELLRKAMAESSPVSEYFSDFYRLFWISWLNPNEGGSALHAEELRRLEAAEREMGLNEEGKLACTLARGWIHFFMGEDEEAWSLFKRVASESELPTGDFHYFFSFLSKTEDWSRLCAWLTEMGPCLAGGDYRFMRSYAEFWEQTVERLPEAEPQMWDTIGRTFRVSSPVFENLLLSRGRWRQWMDLQLSLGREPLEFRVSDLAPIEKNEPELLLPFYHQAVERYVAQKNRDSYKAAVKLLKRLAKLYKKLKREDRWERFFSAFAERHGRLRALQEELRKGKLIS
ncbi:MULTISPECIES: SWIM zinc finger family protein [Cohnella]|uniref:SWIM zinc finger family protein n=1 Tax=Cohnella TaxID=329857 RepID=UPI00111A9DC8|nr:MULTISPECIES: SWIM zinc finger family protein [Cohnella]MBN2981731.1 SWIM zinc finger family protein [Cohnella algarum]